MTSRKEKKNDYSKIYNNLIKYKLNIRLMEEKSLKELENKKIEENERLIPKPKI